ncbi:unnamed protein product [Agarophyton chilense]
MSPNTRPLVPDPEPLPLPLPLLPVQVGQCHDPNFRHRSNMEDETVVERYPQFPALFVAVYDGHGGRLVASLLRQLLHRFFIEELLRHQPPLILPPAHCVANNENLRLPLALPCTSSDSDSDSSNHSCSMPDPPLLRRPSVKPSYHVQTLDAVSAFTRAYAQMDSLLKLRNCSRVGATSVTCFLRNVPQLGRVVTTANCGDTRAVLCRGGRAVRLSEDHRPVDKLERKRIEKAGGFVAWARVNGVLNVSRAFGDHCMKSVVVSTPSITETVLDSADEFMVLACDGLWDFVQEKSVISMAHDAFEQGMDSDKVASVLVKEALRSGSTDNVSVMVLRFDAFVDEQ